MGIALSLLFIAVGLVLALAVTATSGVVDVNTVGWILFVVGLVGLVLDLTLWSPYGLGYMRHRRAGYVDDGRASPARRRRRVVEEDVDDPAAY